MDPLTHGLLGAACTQSLAKRNTIKIAGICGLLGAMAPDLDVLIRSAHDPLLAIEYHRHFTHSIFFAPIGGFLVAVLLYLLFRKKASFKLIYIFTTLGMFTHGLLDASTSYGTRLYWPLDNTRVAWNIISIIDPLFTIPLLVFGTIAFKRKSPRIMWVGLTISMLYFTFCFSQYWRGERFVEQVAESRNHKIDRIVFKTTFGNSLLWRSIYQSGDTYYVDAVYVLPFVEPKLYEGVTAKVIDKETVFPELGSDSVQRNDIRRFSYFSQDYIYMYPGHDNIIADLRYGTLPNDDRAFWGITVNPETPEEHVKFSSLRRVTNQQYHSFWQMLAGKMPEVQKQDN